MAYVTRREICRRFNVHWNTVQNWVNAGKVSYITLPSGHRRYDTDSVMGLVGGDDVKTVVTICYCRVSSRKQKDDLERQAASMRDAFPGAEVVTDIGSGLSEKRPGLKAILDRLCRGERIRLVVAHRDRLARFGFGLIKHMVESNHGEVLVLDDKLASPEEELSKDLLAILHVFSCRMHGLRRYRRQIEEDPHLSDGEPECDPAPVGGDSPVVLQPDRRLSA